ncbi:MAG: hypothetical protein PHN75_17450 [Syntrophales bacterium]|nr:hypothetical protein [Syntrophales bacterium]
MKNQSQPRFKGLPVTCLCIVLTLFIYATSEAIIRVIEKEYTYQATELDTQMSCRTMAIEHVKQIVLEEAGSLVVGRTVVSDNKLDSDQVESVTAGIVGIEIMNESWDGKSFYLKAKAQVDSESVDRALDNLMKNENQLAELDSNRQRIVELMTQVEYLKGELRTKGSDPEAQREYAAQYNDAVQEISSRDMVQESYAYMNNEQYSEAMSTLSRAADITPIWMLGPIFIARSITYQRTGNHEKAMRELDFAQQVDTSPGLTKRVLLNRAHIYDQTGRRAESLKEINRAIKIDPRNYYAYKQRSAIYNQQGDKARAGNDLKQARSLLTARAEARQRQETRRVSGEGQRETVRQAYVEQQRQKERQRIDYQQRREEHQRQMEQRQVMPSQNLADRQTQRREMQQQKRQEIYNQLDRQRSMPQQTIGGGQGQNQQQRPQGRVMTQDQQMMQDRRVQQDQQRQQMQAQQQQRQLEQRRQMDQQRMQEKRFQQDQQRQQMQAQQQHQMEQQRAQEQQRREAQKKVQAQKKPATTTTQQGQQLADTQSRPQAQQMQQRQQQQMRH